MAYEKITKGFGNTSTSPCLTATTSEHFPDHLFSVRQPNTVPSKPMRKAKERLTVTLRVDLLERLRNAVFWTPNLTLARLIQEAVTQYVDALEEKNGEPFSRRIHELKGGRPRQIRAETLHA